MSTVGPAIKMGIPDNEHLQHHPTSFSSGKHVTNSN